MGTVKRRKHRHGGILLYAAVDLHGVRSSGFCFSQKETAALFFQSRRNLEMARENTSALRRLFFFCRRPADYFFMSKGEKSIVIIKLWSCISIIGFVQFIISNSFFTM